jgi:23S rRNA pseudouridine2457 synthase
MPSFLLYKPYGVLSQFTSPVEGKRTLGEWYDFPPEVYPIGRLDEDSEGLLLLTDDNRAKQQFLSEAVEKEYYVQVEGLPTEAALQQLREGVTIRVRKKDHRTRPAKVRRLDPAPDLPPREPPIRFRKSVPDSWLSLTLTEGKNRQVRRMTAKVGFPTLRLIRWRQGPYTLAGMQPGEVRPLAQLRLR